MVRLNIFKFGWLAILCLLAASCATVPWDHERGKAEDEIKLERKRASLSTTHLLATGPTSPLATHSIRRTDWTIEKYASDAHRRMGVPFEVAHVPGNVMLNEGINEMWALVSGGAGTAYNNANSRCGVGDSATAESAAHTDLQAATNKLYVAQNATYPQIGSQQIIFKCDFTSGQANFAWNEFTVDNGAAAAKNLNRKVSAQGTKSSGQTWTLTLTITLS